MIEYNRKLEERARRLRRQMTDSERALWERLRRKQVQAVQFYRQKPIGNYIVDFYAPRAKIVVEVDGSQHMEGRASSPGLTEGSLPRVPGSAGTPLRRSPGAKGDRRSDGSEIPPNPPFRKGGNRLSLRPRIIIKTCVTYD